MNLADHILESSYNAISIGDNISIKPKLLDIFNENSEFFLIIIDSKDKREYWKKYEISNCFILYVDDLINYNFASYNLLIDIESESYNKSIIKNINNIHYNKCWLIFGDISMSYMTTISKEVNFLFKTIDISNEDIFGSTIYLLKDILQDSVENNSYLYKTGIPIRTEFVSFNKFSPLFYNNKEVYLSISDKSKHNLLYNRYLFYKKRTIYNADQKFISEMKKETYRELRNYLNDKRKSIIRNFINIHSKSQFFILKSESSNYLDDFCDTYNIMKACPKIISLYKRKLAKRIISSIVEDIEASTDFVIISDLTYMNIKKLEDIVHKFSCPIIIPYFEKTKDEILLRIIKKDYNTKTVDKYEEFETNRTNLLSV
jgi:hypothetical protein